MATFPLDGLLRQSVYSRLAGYDGLNDAKRLSHDTADLPDFRFEDDAAAWYQTHSTVMMQDQLETLPASVGGKLRARLAARRETWRFDASLATASARLAARRITTAFL